MVWPPYPRHGAAGESRRFGDRARLLVDAARVSDDVVRPADQRRASAPPPRDRARLWLGSPAEVRRLRRTHRALSANDREDLRRGLANDPPARRALSDLGPRAPTGR